MCICFATVQLGQYIVICTQEATSHAVSHESVHVIAEFDKGNADAETVTTIFADFFICAFSSFREVSIQLLQRAPATYLFVFLSLTIR